MGLYKEQTVGWQFDVLWTRSGCVSEGGNDILDHGPRENQIKMYKVTNAIRINHYLIAWQRYHWVTLQMLPSHLRSVTSGQFFVTSGQLEKISSK